MKAEVAKREIESLDYYLQNHTDDYSEESHTAMMMAISALSENKAEWIEGSCGYYECSKCHIKRDSLIKGVFNFCPNCGADMRGD